MAAEHQSSSSLTKHIDLTDLSKLMIEIAKVDFKNLDGKVEFPIRFYKTLKTKVAPSPGVQSQEWYPVLELGLRKWDLIRQHIPEYSILGKDPLPHPCNSALSYQAVAKTHTHTLQLQGACESSLITVRQAGKIFWLVKKFWGHGIVIGSQKVAAKLRRYQPLSVVV